MASVNPCGAGRYAAAACLSELVEPLGFEAAIQFPWHTTRKANHRILLADSVQAASREKHDVREPSRGSPSSQSEIRLMFFAAVTTCCRWVFASPRYVNSASPRVGGVPRTSPAGAVRAGPR